MARRVERRSLVIDGQLKMRSELDLGNVRSQLSAMAKSLEGMKFNDKTARGLTDAFERINMLLPDLQRQMKKGVFDEDEMRDYLANSKKLTVEFGKLSSMLRNMGERNIILDSDELKDARTEVDRIKKSIADLQKGFGINRGVGGTNIETYAKAIENAAKTGKSTQEALDKLKATKFTAKEANEARKEEIQKENTLLLAQKELLEQIQVQIARPGKAYSDEAKGYIAELKQLIEAGTTASGSKVWANIVQGSPNKGEKQSRITAVLKEIEDRLPGVGKLVVEFEREAEKATRAWEDLLSFESLNANQLQIFDTTLTKLAQELSTSEKEAEALKNTLSSELLTALQAMAREGDSVNQAFKNSRNGAIDFSKASEEMARETENATNAFKNKIKHLFGLYNIYHLIRRGITQAYQSIKQLDEAMTAIAVVTEKTTGELWGQIDAYMAIAKQYGVSTQGVYEVSKLYYQQGKNVAEVSKLTAETLKMARIAGLDYAKATDFLTATLNGFSLGMDHASHVVDVYSKLSATAAVDTQELAYAMSKSASIMASAGSSFENTSVFLTQMIETTREAPENLGSAMKTIAARFTEIKKNPLELISVEDEEISLNKVDEALKSAGMTIQDTAGQMRDLDEVIYELSSRWDGLDRMTQRYIATAVAGSRQQSRFLSLMQDNERLTELREEAMNSEDAGLIQFSKTLDSVESKLNNLATAFQQFYMSIINGTVVKGFIGAVTTIIDAFNSLPKGLVLILVPAVILITQKLVSTLGTIFITGVKTGVRNMVDNVKSGFSEIRAESKLTATAIGQDLANAGKQGPLTPGDGGGAGKNLGGLMGSATKGVSTFMQGLSYVYMVVAAVSAVVAIVDLFVEDAEEKVARLKKAAEEADIQRAVTKDELKNLQSLEKKYRELDGVQNKNLETQEEYNALRAEIADAYPELIKYIDSEGNAVLDMANAYEVLAEKKKEAYDEALLKSLQADLSLALDYDAAAKDMGVNLKQTRVERERYAQARERYESGLYIIDQNGEEIVKQYSSIAEALIDILNENVHISDNIQRRIDDKTIPEQGYSLKDGRIFLHRQFAQTALGYEDEQTEEEEQLFNNLLLAGSSMTARSKGIAKKLGHQVVEQALFFGDYTADDLSRMHFSQEAMQLWGELGISNIKDEKAREKAVENFKNQLFTSVNDYLDVTDLDSDLRKEANKIIKNQSRMSLFDYESISSEMQKELGEEAYRDIGKTIELRDASILTHIEEIFDIVSDSFDSSSFKGIISRWGPGVGEIIANMGDKLIKQMELGEETEIESVSFKSKQEVSDFTKQMMATLFVKQTEEDRYLIEQAIDSGDISTISGWVRIFEGLKQIDGINKKSIDAASRLIDGNFIPQTNETLTAIKNYLEVFNKINDINFDDVGIENIIDWLDAGYITDDDFTLEDGLFRIIPESIESLKNNIAGIDKVVYDRLIALGIDVEDYFTQLQAQMDEQKTKQANIAAIRELDFSGKLMTISKEAYNALSEMLNLDDVHAVLNYAGDYEISSVHFEDLKSAMQSAMEEAQTAKNYLVANFLRSTLQGIAEASKKDADALFSSALSSVDSKTGIATISSELAEFLGLTLSKLTTVGIDKYEITITQLIDSLAQSIDGDEGRLKEAENLLKDLKEARQDFIEKTVESITSVLEKGGADVLRLANNKVVADEAIARMFLGPDAKLERVVGGYRVDNAREDWEKLFEAMGRNIYDGIDLLTDLEKKLYQAKKLTEVLNDVRNMGTKEATRLEKARALQIALAYADAIFSPDSYDFMSSSETNTQLAPMYTLAKATQTAIEALEEAEKTGTIGVENLNAMLDFVGRDKAEFKELSKISKSLTPPLKTEMTPEEARLLENAVKGRAQEKVDEYNDSVRLLNDHLDTLIGFEGDTELVKNILSLQDDQFDNFGQLFREIELTRSREEIDRMLMASAIYEDDAEAFIARLVSAGWLTTQEARDEELKRANELADNTTSLQDLSAAVDRLSNIILTGSDGIGNKPSLDDKGDLDKKTKQISAEESKKIKAVAELENIRNEYSDLIEDENSKLLSIGELITSAESELAGKKFEISLSEAKIVKLKEDYGKMRVELEDAHRVFIQSLGEDASKERELLTQQHESLIDNHNATLTFTEELIRAAQDELDRKNIEIALLNETIDGLKEESLDTKENIKNAKHELDVLTNRVSAQIKQNEQDRQAREGISPGDRPDHGLSATDAPVQVEIVGDSSGTGEGRGGGRLDEDRATTAMQDRISLDPNVQQVTEGLGDVAKGSEDAASSIDALSDSTEVAADTVKTAGEGLASTISGTIMAGILQAKQSIAGGAASAALALYGLVNKINNIVITGPKVDSPGGRNPLGTPEYKATATGGKFFKNEQNVLVGELGPEIAVVDGEYYLVGQNGPERVNLPKNSIVLNHLQTQQVFGKKSRSLGQARALSDYYRSEITMTLGSDGKPIRGGSGANDFSPADFDRWHNYLRLIENVSNAIAELQARRENLRGRDVTQSLLDENALLEQQARQVLRYRDAQQEYIDTFLTARIKEYGDVLTLTDGVLQIHWDALQGMDSEAAEPIQDIISLWKELTDGISQSNQELERFQTQVQKNLDLMRDHYIDVEGMVIAAIKNRQQMIIDNLRKELEVRQKYDNQYLNSLKKSIEEERKLRSRGDTEEATGQLRRRLALLQRDTSGRSDLAIAEVMRQLRDADRAAYDQRQDDFLVDEEEALRKAQEVMQEELEIQTDILTLMESNVQLIQGVVDDVMKSGDNNIVSFLKSWDKNYIEATPTVQTKLDEEFEDKAGKAGGWLASISGNMAALVQGFNSGTWFPTKEIVPGGSSGGSSGGGGGGGGSSSSSSSTTKTPYKVTLKASDGASFSGESWASRAEATKIAEQKLAEYEARLKAAKNKEAIFPTRPLSGIMQAETGGLATYTGPVIVHGSKDRPERILSAQQTAAFERLVDFLDATSLVARNSISHAYGMNDVGGKNILIDNFNFTATVSNDYEMKHAIRDAREEIISIARFNRGVPKIG